MRLTLAAERGYRHVGGAILTRDAQLLPIGRALDLFAFFLGQAVCQGDADSAGYCAGAAKELLVAIVAYDDFHCAAAAISRRASPLAGFRASLGV